MTILFYNRVTKNKIMLFHLPSYYIIKSLFSRNNFLGFVLGKIFIK